MQYLYKYRYVSFIISTLIAIGVYFSMTALVFGQTAATDGESGESVMMHHHPASALEGDPLSFTTHRDVIPNFAANPTVTSKQSGNWFNPDTWTQGRIPSSEDVVLIRTGHVIKYNGTSNSEIAVIGVKGTLVFDTTINTKLKVGTILVYREGRMDVGTKSSPVQNNVKAEIIIADRPLATTSPDPSTGVYDPLQYGNGIVAFGMVNMHGKTMTPTWLRLAKEPKAGNTTLTLESAPSGWSVGDKLVLPDTRQNRIVRIYSLDTPTPIDMHLEEMTIAGISGNTITLSSPLRYDHLAGRDTDGAVVALPHVGNLTRNIVISSENPNGVRGHIMFTERADVDVRYVELDGMGRTTAEPLNNTVMENGVATQIGSNQIGRYPIHFHHLMGPENPTNTGYQFAVVGLAINDGAKWGIAVHNSHFGLIDNNVVYDIEGSGIITEEGNERENVFSNNFLVKMGTMVNSYYEPRYGGVAGFDRPLGFGDFGYEGTALWFTGMDNYVTGNVGANAAYAGLMYNARPRGFAWNEPRIPKFRGADIGDDADWIVNRPGTVPAPSVRLSKDNEAYASGVGLWVSFSANVGHISDFLGWNIKQQGMYSQRNINASYSNIKIVSDQSVSNQNDINARLGVGVNLYNGTYQAGHVSLKDIHIEGFNIGIELPSYVQANIPASNMSQDITPVTVIDGAYLRNFVNVTETTTRWAPKYTLLKDVKFVLNSGPANRYLADNPINIITQLETTYTDAAVVYPSRTFVYNYNQQPGNNFELYFTEQAPDYIMTARTRGDGVTLLDRQNCPTPGMTNQQCWNTYQVAYNGRVASCSTTKTGIDGFTCPITDSSTFESILAKAPEPAPEPPLPDGGDGSNPDNPDVVDNGGDNGDGTGGDTGTTTDPVIPTPTLQISASDTTISSGDSVTISWSSTNSTSCSASDDWTGVKAVSGSETIRNLTQTKTYTLACVGEGGTATKSVTVNVEDNDTTNDFSIVSHSIKTLTSDYGVLEITLNKQGTITVNYGNSSDNLINTVSSNVASVVHSVTLDKLKGNSTYYQVVAKDGVGTTISSVAYTFPNVKSNNSNNDNRGGGGGSKSNKSSLESASLDSSYTESTSYSSSVISTNMAVGSKSEEVRRLQQLLNSDPATQIAVSGDGAKGNETNFYGSLTAMAVGKFQLKYGVLSSINDEGYGQVGPKTRAKINEVFGQTVNQYTPTPASSDLSADRRAQIQAQINQLLQTVQMLQLQLVQMQGGGISNNSNSGSQGAFLRNLAYGSEGEDVRRLQVLLNRDPDTRVASTGDGAPGYETTFFGVGTEDAVKRFQVKHGIVYSGTPETTGYGAFGPSTRAVAAGL
ncbi:MAG: G8 domain-containing protein [Candidatus Paceibacterota bacterium]